MTLQSPLLARLAPITPAPAPTPAFIRDKEEGDDDDAAAGGAGGEEGEDKVDKRRGDIPGRAMLGLPSGTVGGAPRPCCC